MPSEYVQSPTSIYYIQKPLGKGSFGEVVLARRREDNMPAALKTARGPDPHSWQRANQILKDEARAVIRMRHANIALVLEAFYDSHDEFCVAYEFCSEGDLWGLCNEGGRVSREWVLDVLVPGILDALDYIDTRFHLVHGDISPANILVKRSRDGKLYPKLNDFGMCKTAAVRPRHNHYSICEPPHWRIWGTPAGDVYQLLIAVAWVLNLPYSPSSRAGNFREMTAMYGETLESFWGEIHQGIPTVTPVLRPFQRLFSEPRPGEFNPRTLSEGRAGEALMFLKQGGRLGGGFTGMIESTEDALRHLHADVPVHRPRRPPRRW